MAKIKVGQKISIRHSGTTVVKYEVCIAPFIYEIEVLDNIK